MEIDENLSEGSSFKSKDIEELANLIAVGPVVIYTCEAFGEFAATFVTPNIYPQLGYEPEEFMSTPGFWASNIHPDDREHTLDNLSCIFQKGSYSHEYRFRHKNGCYRWMNDDLRLISDESGKPRIVVGYWTDITERKILEEKLKFMSSHDTLTRLPNRNLLMDRLDQALSRADRNKDKVAVIFVDLDDFKIINDTLGHNLGDKALKIIANRLCLCLRETDTVARYGGDEFVILLSDITNEKNITLKMEEIIKVTSESINIDGNELFISISAGISIYPSNAKNYEQLLLLADNAMYAAKKKGSNSFKISNS